MACILLSANLLSGGGADQAPLSQPELTILSRDAGVLVVKINFPMLEGSESPSGTVLKMGNLPRLPGPNGHLLPAYRTVIPGEAGAMKVRILEARTAILPLEHPPVVFAGDRRLSESDRTAPLKIKENLKASGKKSTDRSTSNGWVTVRALGEHRRMPLALLQIQPVRWNGRTREITHLRSLKLRLEFPTDPGRGRHRTNLPASLRTLSASIPLPGLVNTPPPPPPTSNSAGETRLKIFVSEEGLYHLNSSDFASQGISLSSVDPRTIRLENRGEEQPIYVYGEADGRFDEGDYIEFWGEALHGTYIEQNPEIYSDLYTDVNVYWLSWGGPLGARLVEESGEIVEVNELKMFRATSYPSFVHSEQNNYFNRLSQVGPDSLKEHWYYDAAIQASQTRNYDVHLPYPDNASLVNARVRVALQGLTHPVEGQGGQHHAYVSLENQTSPALEAGSSSPPYWTGQTGIILDAQGNEGIPSNVLKQGTNQLSIFIPVDTPAGSNDKILLNWFQITYQRLYKADSDLIRFAPPEAAVDTLVDFRIDGFTTSQIDIFKLGQSKIINAEIMPYQSDGETFYSLHFQDRPYGNRDYVTLTPAAKLPPDSTRADVGSDILGSLTSGSPVKMLVITSRVFENHPDLGDFMARRGASLGRTELVFIDDIFDELSHGIYSPQAIKDLLLALPTPPEFLLLVGDGSYDTRNRYGLGGNLIPAYFIQTKAYGSVASDFWYSQLDGDMIPDLAVGRISARDDEELTSYLEKLEEYETDPEPGAWRSTHLFVSGTGGAAGTTFQSMSQLMISRLEDDIRVERLGTEPITSPFYGATPDLIDLLDDGALVVDYNGHGAGAVWSDNSLFRVEDLPNLSNRGKYPFVTNFTCFIGAFDTPEQGGILGEEFIFEPQKGAIGVLASTGLGWYFNGSWLQEELVGLLYDDPELRLGELINAGKIAYYSYYGQGGSAESFDTIHLMNLLGDPSLKLAFASLTEEAPLASPEFALSGDSISVTLPGEFSDYQGILRIYDNFDYPALQYGMPFEIPLIPDESGIGVDFVLPELGDSTYLTGGTYRLSLWDPSGTSNCRTAAPLYFLDAFADSSVVDSLSPYPYPVYARDAFGFRARILDVQGVQSARAHFRIETNEGTPIIEHDSLALSPATVPPWYETTATIDTTIYPYGVGDRVIVWVKTEDTQGDTTSSDEFIFYILDSRADPDWVDQSLSMGMRENKAALIIEVENKGKTDIDSVDIEFFLAEPQPQLIGSTVLYDLEAGASAEAFVFSTLEQPGSYDLEMQMNTGGWVDDVNPTEPYMATLVADHFTITTSAGTGDTLIICDTTVVVDTLTADTVVIGGIYRAFIPPGGISGEMGVLVFKYRDDLTLAPTQSGLSFVPLNESEHLTGFEIALPGGIGIVGDSLNLTVYLYQDSDSLLSIEDLSLHLQEPDQALWKLLRSEVETLSFPPEPSYRISAGSRWEGAYTVLQNSDKQGPDVEISVEGQIYTEGGYVPSQPKISALVQDAGGVNATPGNYWVSVDGVVFDSSLVSVSSENSGQVLMLSINPTFGVGDHSVSVVAQDLSGNAGSASIEFQVMGQFRLDFLGNYPNPFKNKTYFAFRLTEQTTEPVCIRIYTVSGRLIRTLHSNSPDEINYSEIYWDGRDQDGATIANGVYFYKLTAKRGDHKIERTMKLAKLR